MIATTTEAPQLSKEDQAAADAMGRFAAIVVERDQLKADLVDAAKRIDDLQRSAAAFDAMHRQALEQARGEIMRLSGERDHYMRLGTELTTELQSIGTLINDALTRHNGAPYRSNDPGRRASIVHRERRERESDVETELGEKLPALFTIGRQQ